MVPMPGAAPKLAFTFWSVAGRNGKSHSGWMAEIVDLLRRAV
jgi:hypothetical protein